MQCYQRKSTFLYLRKFYATLNAFFAMHHHNECNRTLHIETNTDAIQVQVADFTKI